MTRIKYTWHWKDRLITSDPILAGDDTYTVIIGYSKGIGFHIENSKGKTVCVKKCKNIRQAKVKAKQELMKMGAVFFDEVRRK